MPSATTSDYVYKSQMDFFFYRTAFDSHWDDNAYPNIYVGLFISGGVPPLSGATGNEITDASGPYERQPVVRTNAGWSYNSTNFQYSNVADLQWNPPSVSWGTVAAAALFFTGPSKTTPPFGQSNSANSLLFVADLTTPKAVNVGDGGPKILAGQLRISRADCG